MSRRYTGARVAARLRSEISPANGVMRSRTTSFGIDYGLLVGAERGMAALLSALPTSRARMEGGRWPSVGGGSVELPQA